MFHRRSSVVPLYLYSRFVVLFPGFLLLLLFVFFFFCFFFFVAGWLFFFFFFFFLGMTVYWFVASVLFCRELRVVRMIMVMSVHGIGGLLYGWLPSKETYIARTFRSCRDRISAGHRRGMRVARVSYLSVTRNSFDLSLFLSLSFERNELFSPSKLKFEQL